MVENKFIHITLQNSKAVTQGWIIQPGCRRGIAPSLGCRWHELEGAAADAWVSRASVQRDLARLQEWLTDTSWNSVTINPRSCTCDQVMLFIRTRWWEQLWGEVPDDADGKQAENESVKGVVKGLWGRTYPPQKVALESQVSAVTSCRIGNYTRIQGDCSSLEEQCSEQVA